MSIIQSFLLMTLLLSTNSGQIIGPVFDPTQNPCDSDVFMPGCYIDSAADII